MLNLFLNLPFATITIMVNTYLKLLKAILKNIIKSIFTLDKVLAFVVAFSLLFIFGDGILIAIFIIFSFFVSHTLEHEGKPNKYIRFFFLFLLILFAIQDTYLPNFIPIFAR